MSADNGKGEKKPEAAKDKVKVNIMAHTTIMQLVGVKQNAQSRLELALTVLKHQLGVPPEWTYDTDHKAFMAPAGTKVQKLGTNRISEKPGSE